MAAKRHPQNKKKRKRRVGCTKEKKTPATKKKRNQSPYKKNKLRRHCAKLAMLANPEKTRLEKT